MNITKGTWTTDGLKVSGQAGLTYVADCYPYNEKKNRPKLYEAEANARLIASAPDLYEALATWMNPFSPLSLEQKRIMSQKALAKSEGRE